jgi:hypothetical protein
MATDWIGLGITIAIVLFLVLLVWAKMQGDTIIEILSEIRDFMRGET